MHKNNKPGHNSIQNNDEDEDSEQLDFYEMGIDDRILKAIAVLGWKQPTLIQEKAIPLALDGNDILARARTGSGKTAVYSISVIDKILKFKLANPYAPRKTRALILAPSKELCNQIKNNIAQLLSCCIREVKCIDIACSEVREIKPLLQAECPDIIVATPSKIRAHIEKNSLKDLKSTLDTLVIDEADLLLSFGFQEDMDFLLDKAIPKDKCQSFLVSATLNPDVLNLKKLFLRKPVVIRLEEPELPQCDQLAQYHVNCQDDEKFVLLIALIKLKLLNGRTIIFVDSLNRCFKVKLFLECFSVKSCLLNSELPVTSRCNVVDQFNKGVYDIIIACDEKCVQDPTVRKKSDKATRRKLDKEFAVSRGIDFQSVSNVINFDFPTTVTSYIHRVGRTARALMSINSNITEGTVLSFVSMDEQKYFNKLKQAFGDSLNLKPYAFKMNELEAFKYRSKDAIRAATKRFIRDARFKEIRQELRNSSRLKSILKTNPNDIELLRHDRSVKKINTPSCLKDVPDYIVPSTLRNRHKHLSLAEKRRLQNQTELQAPTSKKSIKKTLKKKKTRQSDPLQGKAMASKKKKLGKKKKGKRNNSLDD